MPQRGRLCQIRTARTFHGLHRRRSWAEEGVIYTRWRPVPILLAAGLRAAVMATSCTTLTRLPPARIRPLVATDLHTHCSNQDGEQTPWHGLTTRQPDSHRNSQGRSPPLGRTLGGLRFDWQVVFREGTNLGINGLVSADRNNKATLLLTGPFRTAKSSAKDLIPRVLKLQYANYHCPLQGQRRNRLLRCEAGAYTYTSTTCGR